MTTTDASPLPAQVIASQIPSDGTAGDESFRFETCRAAVDRLVSRQLFFIGGFFKSGTTWLQIMLDAHPDICCRGEGHLANRLAPLLRAALQRHNATLARKNNVIFKGMPPFPEFNEAHFRYLLVSAIALLLDAASAGTEAAVGEKTPDNASHFGLLAALFPRAKFVHIVRDVRDCAVSGWFHNLRIEPSETERRFGSFGSFLGLIGEQWTEAIGVAAAFADAHPGRLLEVRYEDLITNPRKSLRPLVHFLGVATTPQLIDACCAAAVFEKLSGGRQRGEEDRASFFRRGLPGDWRNHLSDADNRAVLAICGAAMARYGYE